MTEPYTLTRQPAERPRVEHFENTKATQRVLLSGLDCLPGQQDLFATDGEEDRDAERKNN